MEYSKQVEKLIERIAIFAIKSKNLAPNSIMYNIEKTRLMESALELQLVGRKIDSQLKCHQSTSNAEIEDFKHEWKCIEESINTLTIHLEMEIKYSQMKTAGNDNGIAGPSVSQPVRLDSSTGNEEKAVAHNIQQLPVPIQPPGTPGNAERLGALQPDSPCLCPRCSALLHGVSSPQQSLVSSACSCENCAPWLYPQLLSPEIPSSDNESSVTSLDSGFESSGVRRFL